MPGSNSFKDRIRISFAAVSEVKSSTKELICAWIQVTGSVALAVYTYANGTHRIWPFMFFGIAVGGTHNFFKTLRRNKCTETRRTWSSWDFAIATSTYSAGVYAFSEGYQRNDNVWIPCLVLAASGYYFTSWCFNSLDTVLYGRPWLKCCQLMSEPAVVACGATYLFYFRHHTEEWLKRLPFIMTAATGLKLADRGYYGYASMYHGNFLKASEMFIGGFILCTSCTVLVLYSPTNDFFWPWTAFMSLGSLFGAFVAYESYDWFQALVDMVTLEYIYVCGIISGTIVFFSAFIGVKCISNPRDPVMLTIFFVTAGVGLTLFEQSLISLEDLVSLAVFQRYCQRVVGSLLTVYSSAASVYIGYHMGWRFSLPTMTFAAAGVYAAYNGFSEGRVEHIDENL